MTGLEIIGAGFGRTGTTSLRVALECLGYHTYHMEEVNQLNHEKYWVAAERGELESWEQIFDGYRATLDWPSTKYYKELLAKYPNAKVILSTRDPESWYTSAYQTIYFPHRKTSLRLLEWFLPGYRRHQEMLRLILWKGTFQDRFADKDYAMSVFKEHNEEVKRVVPSEQLLVFNPKEGWEPLCQFLGKPIPPTPFPHVNDSQAFQRLMNKRVQTRNRILAYMGAFPVVVFALYRWYSLGRFPLLPIFQKLLVRLKLTQE
ncbi:hypothetical protein K493DRAFT_316802 [Basidiobolus meristosporus CBS 931.73]|uniref:Sulfotransferase family protein n=1 Tax=Basidiobolus meristosporus CBS 931.73 TaxID=1314790 RepID=A0A1Y1Y2B3_9FUNG|nr:hypothetical protein K493DRAFT_316802 [Basidiobolus meristosporus CBS 931.73]|eukprot:ORX92130.1 hypothetical protein K493DRAFT_316802 [Basidiobolus meristosporus CBS 931.73]